MCHCHIFQTGRPTYFKLGTQMEHEDPCYRKSILSGQCMSTIFPEMYTKVMEFMNVQRQVWCICRVKAVWSILERFWGEVRTMRRCTNLRMFTFLPVCAVQVLLLVATSTENDDLQNVISRPTSSSIAVGMYIVLYGWQACCTVNCDVLPQVANNCIHVCVCNVCMYTYRLWYSQCIMYHVYSMYKFRS